jgi:hypothetical protein
MHDDLKQRLRDEVDAELGSRPPRNLPEVLTRGRSKRLALRLVTTMSMVLLGTALVAGGLWIAGVRSLSTERSFIQPAGENASPSEPTPSETPENAEGSGPRYNILDGEVAFRAAKPWEPNVESVLNAEGSLPSEFALFTRFDGRDTSCGSPRSSCAAFVVLADPAPRQGSCSQTGGTVVSAEALARAIGAHPGLQSTERVAEPIGDIDALRLDVAAAEGASTCGGSGEGIGFGDGVPVLTATRHTKLGAPVVPVIEPGKRMRVYLLDLPEGAARTLAIMIVAPEADFDAAIAAARPILDSFEFQFARQGTD